MKKFFPIVIIVIVFTGFLTGQIVFDFLPSSAGLSPKEQALHDHYAKIFEKLTVQTTRSKKRIRLKEIKAPIVVLNFWASWCQPCLVELPSLVKMKEKFSDEELQVFGINSDEKNHEKIIKKIEKKYKLNFGSVADKENQILEKFKVETLPFSIVFNRGKVFKLSMQALDFNGPGFIQELRDIIKKP